MLKINWIIKIVVLILLLNKTLAHDTMDIGTAFEEDIVNDLRSTDKPLEDIEKTSEHHLEAMTDEEYDDLKSFEINPEDANPHSINDGFCLNEKFENEKIKKIISLGLNKAFHEKSTYKPGTVSNGVYIPKCGEGPCDNPKFRDFHYSNDKKYRFITLKFHIMKGGKEFGGNEKMAREHIRGMTLELNKIYEKARFLFKSIVSFYKSKYVGYKFGTSMSDCEREMKKDPELKKCYSPMRLLRELEGDQWQKKPYFNILIVSFVNPRLNGYGNFPWYKDFHGSLVMSHQRIYKGCSTLAHELGHCLGLYHTFRGIDEDGDLSCHACREVHASDLTGDLCKDTNPTPMHWECQDPSIIKFPDKCMQRVAWVNTPFTNLMSYGHNFCRQDLTEIQIRRMKCWYDHFRFKKSNILPRLFKKKINEEF